MAEDQIYEQDQVTTGDPDPLRRLYDVVKEKELYTKSFDEFKKKYSDPAERDKLYAVVSDPSRQLYRKSREEFEAKYFPTTGPDYSTMDVLAVAKKRKELQNTLKDKTAAYTSSASGGITDPYKLKEVEGYNRSLKELGEHAKKAGYDDSLLDDLEDLPEGEGFSAKTSVPDLVKLRETNRHLYNRKLAAIKSKGELHKAIGAKDGVPQAKYEIQQLQQLERADSREATRREIELTRKYVDDDDEQHKIIKNIIADKSYDYGMQPLKDDPRFQNLNPYQQRAMQFLEDIDPATFQAFQQVLANDPTGQFLGSKERSIMRGYETKARELENIGMNLMQKSYEEKMTEYSNKALAGAITPDDKKRYDELMSQLEKTDADIEKYAMSDDQRKEYQRHISEIDKVEKLSHVRKLHNHEIARYNRHLQYAQEIADATIGRGVYEKRNALAGEINQLRNKYKEQGLSTDEQADYERLQQEYETLAADKTGQNKRYPYVAAVDAQRLMQESMGANNSIVKKTVLGIGENFDDAINWVGGLITDRGAYGDLELLGDKEITENMMRYTPEQDKLVGSDVIARFDEDLQKEIDAVKSGNLSDDKKRDKISKLIFDNQDKIQYIPNDRAGKVNFTAKAVLGQVAEVTKDLVSQLAIATVTGGAGNASKVKQLTSLFGSTFATAYDDYYAEALRKNIPNPSQYAITHTAIEASTELISNDFDVAKRLVGKTSALGKVINNINKEQWDAFKKKGLFSNIKDAALQGSQVALRNAAEETGEEVTGQLLGNLADQKIFNQETGVGEGVGETAISTFIGMLPLGLLSMPFSYNKISRNQKYALYEAAMNPDKFLNQVKEDLENGAIDEREAEVRKAGINRAAMSMGKVQTMRPDGSVLTDNEKAEYLTNQIVIDQIAEQKKSVPAEQKEKLEAVAEKLDNENAELLKSKKKKSEKTKAEETKAETVRVPEEPQAVEAEVTQPEPLQPEKPKKKAKEPKAPTGTITSEEAAAIAEREMGKIKAGETARIDELIAKPQTEARDTELKVSLSHAEDMISNATEYIDQFKKSGDQKQVKRYEDMLQQYTDIKNKIVGAIGEQTKQQEETTAATPNVDVFKQHVYEQVETISGTDAGRLDIPGMQPKEVRKAVADIRAGRTSSAARKLEMALDDIVESGQVPLIQGTGGHAQRIDVPFSEYMKKVTEPETQDLPIETPEALESELAKLFAETPKERKKPTAGKSSQDIADGDTVTGIHAGTQVVGKVLGKKEDGRYRVKGKDGTIYLLKPGPETRKVDDAGALPKQGKGIQKVFRPKDEDITQYTPQSIIEKSREYFKDDPLIKSVTDFLEPLIKANKNVYIDHNVKFIPAKDDWVETEDGAETKYEIGPGKFVIKKKADGSYQLTRSGKRGGVLHTTIYGSYDTISEAKEDAVDPDLGYSKETGAIHLNFEKLSDYDNLYRTALHEMVHVVTRYELHHNQAFNDEVSEILRQAKEAEKIDPLSIKMDLLKEDLSSYGFSNEHEFIAELFTNQEFYDRVKKLKYKGESIIEKIWHAIARLFSRKYRELVGAKAEITADNLADYLMQLTESIISGKTGEDTAGALPMAAGKSINTPQAAIKKLIKQASPSISDEKLLEVLHNGSGINKDTLQQWINEIRHPPPPTPPSFTAADLSPEEENVEINKVEKIFSKKPPKEPGWWKQFLTKFKNLSAWIENPYRFVTKITEDIRREYKIPRKDRAAIPLGRAFEKNAAGRAALKVQAFVDEVLLGKIGKKKYGRIKGEKLADFQKFLAMNRVIDRLDTEQTKREAGENVSRSTGNITRITAQAYLNKLERKYGAEGMEEFEARSRAFQEHMDKMLKNIQAAGIISQETYDQIKEDNNYYAPFSIIQTKLIADQEGQPVGISGVVKRIQGIGADLPTTTNKALEELNVLAKAAENKEISLEDYYRAAVTMVGNLQNTGVITQQEHDNMIAQLENPAFFLQDIIDAAANMIYKSEGMALKNTMMQRLYSYKKFDTKGLFIQDVDGFKPTTMKGGQVVMVPKPLNTIPVEPGMAPIKLLLDGKPVLVAVNKQAAEKLNTMSNFEVASILKASDFINRIFRAIVITLSPGFQAVNLMIDFIRTTMLSRYGLFAGKGLVQPLVNAILYVPQYIEALIHSAAGNLGAKTDTYKQWMESDSFSKGMFDNLFDNEKRIKEMTAPNAKRTLMNFLKLFEIPGTILEQTHKIAIHQRGSAVEGLNPESITGMLAAMFNNHVSDNMTKQELSDAADRLNYEVQNFAGSPNFPQTHKWMKLTSLFLQFFSARIKGEVTDYRRVANLFTGRGEGVKLSAQERTQMIMQFAGITSVIVAYAMKNLVDDEDEKQFDSIPQYHQANYMNVPAGEFVFEFEDGSRETLRDYIKIPLRGLTATLNVVANSVVRYLKHEDPKSLKQAFLGTIGNASPVNLHGNDEREFGESLVSNLTPVFKYYLEYSFNRDTHKHRDIISEWGGENSKLEQYKAWSNSTEPDDQRPGIPPWEVVTKQTPKWCAEWSKFIYDNLGIAVSAATLDHIENTMGNPTELYNKAVSKRLVRSKMKYPVAGASGHVVEDEEEETENEE